MDNIQRHGAGQPQFWRNGEPVYRRCGWCKRLIDDDDEAYGRPKPELWPTTDGICKTCRRSLHR